MEKIHIAIITESAYPLFNPSLAVPFGGAEVDLYNLAVYLAKNPRYFVTFYVGDFGQTEEPEMFQNVHLQKINMFGWHQKSLKEKVLYYFHLWKTLWKSDADIILTKMAGQLPGWGAIFFKVLKKKHHIHRLAHDRDTTFTTPASMRSRREYYLYRYGLKKADCILSQTLQQQILLKERMGVESQVIPNGFFVSPTINGENKNTILWVGRCAPVKRPELFIELAKRLPEQKFVMIMMKPSVMETEDFKQKSKLMIAEAKKLPNLLFKDYVPFGEVQRYYNEARLYVSTSEIEGFSNAFIQACLGSTPIASLNVNPDGFISENQLGIYCDDDFEAMVDFIAKLNDKEVTRLGSNARNYVQKHHDISITGSLYEKAIEDLMKIKK